MSIDISSSKWAQYKSIISRFMDKSAANKNIQWLRFIDQPSLFGEDDLKYMVTDIGILISDNSYRNWPINQTTITGEIDNQTLSIWVSRSYLESRGLLNTYGYFNFNRASDMFIINGIIYRSSGDLESSQAYDEELLFMIILKRDDDEKVYNRIKAAFPYLL